MGDLSYDKILGRDWCEDNGDIIDFAKQKIYSGTPLSENLRYPNTPHFEHFLSATREFSIVLHKA